jgi:hypothetical protein
VTGNDLDDELTSWDELHQSHDWSGLLLGNGFSRNICDRFAYSSLFETARSESVTPKLAKEDLDLFERFGTHNFEMILSALSTAISVTHALQKDTQFLRERYESIRLALIAAVHHVHLPWSEFKDESRTRVAQALSDFEYVYSTNYDLLAYWSIMHDSKTFKDYFWGEEFDITDTEIWGKCTKVVYLHGGLHLYRRPNGQTLKRSAEPFRSLLDLFATPFRDAVPLFTSEGTAEEKLASIYRSDNLSFAYFAILSACGAACRLWTFNFRDRLPSARRHSDA